MLSQAPQNNAADLNAANQPVEQVGTRDFQQQAIGLELAKLVKDAGDINGLLQGLVRIILNQSKCNGMWLGSTSEAKIQADAIRAKVDFVALIKPDSLWAIVEPQMRVLTNSAFETHTVCQAPLTGHVKTCLLYTSPSPRDQRGSRMPSSP